MQFVPDQCLKDVNTSRRDTQKEESWELFIVSYFTLNQLEESRLDQLKNQGKI